MCVEISITSWMMMKARETCQCLSTLFPKGALLFKVQLFESEISQQFSILNCIKVSKAAFWNTLFLVLHYSWVSTLSTTTIVDTLWAHLWCIHNHKCVLSLNINFPLLLKTHWIPNKIENASPWSWFTIIKSYGIFLVKIEEEDALIISIH